MSRWLHIEPLFLVRLEKQIDCTMSSTTTTHTDCIYEPNCYKNKSSAVADKRRHAPEIAQNRDFSWRTIATKSREYPNALWSRRLQYNRMQKLSSYGSDNARCDYLTDRSDHIDWSIDWLIAIGVHAIAGVTPMILEYYLLDEYCSVKLARHVASLQATWRTGQCVILCGKVDCIGISTPNFTSIDARVWLWGHRNMLILVLLRNTYTRTIRANNLRDSGDFFAVYL